MTEKVKKYLSDVLMAIELIEQFVETTPDFGTYSDDLKTQSAVERQLGVVGEALNNIRKQEPGLEIKNDTKI